MSAPYRAWIGDADPDGTPMERSIQLTAASTIRVRPVRWLWEGRLPAGSLCLLAGREGIGKSTCAYTVAADVTRGRMAGCCYGQPKSVIVAATEDSWAHTIVPRLMAAGADLERVFRVDVVDIVDGEEMSAGELSLPADVDALAVQVREVDAAMVLLDPLMSRLHAKLDAHRDGEVRQALEPLVRLAERREWEEAAEQADRYWYIEGLVRAMGEEWREEIYLVFQAVPLPALCLDSALNEYRARFGRVAT